MSIIIIITLVLPKQCAYLHRIERIVVVFSYIKIMQLRKQTVLIERAVPQMKTTTTIAVFL